MSLAYYFCTGLDEMEGGVKKTPCLVLLFAVACMTGCGGSTNTCKVSASVTPASATANHNAAVPGNQVQFSISSTVTGNCPLIPDAIGTWSTSDPVHTSISNQASSQGLATCLAATTAPATISTTGTVRGHAINSATLTCQ
jgi:hypothetical protein